MLYYQNIKLKPFPHAIQMTVENIVAKGAISHYEQFLILLQSFQYNLIIIGSFQEIFKTVCCRIVVFGKDYLVACSMFMNYSVRVTISRIQTHFDASTTYIF